MATSKFDGTDVAFFTIGVGKYLARIEGSLRDPDTWGGQVGFVQRVIEVVTGPESGFDMPEDGFAGVFAYEVMEPLGEACAEFVDHMDERECTYEEFYENKFAELLTSMQGGEG